MPPATPFGTEDGAERPPSPLPGEPSGSHAWLFRLRLYAAGFGWVTVLVGAPLFGLSGRIGPLMGLFALSLVVNLVLFLAPGLRDGGRRRTRREVGFLLVSDIMTLSGMLYLMGGPGNPLTIFFVVPVMVAALLLGTRWTWGMAALSALAYGLLFPFHLPMEGHGVAMGHGMAVGPEGHAPSRWSPLGPTDLHLYWMYLSFLGGIGCVGLLMSHLVRALSAERDRFLDSRAQSERFRAVATLAGGAAHELATPLSTIAIIARELELRETPSDPIRTREEMAEIRVEVDRCREILDRLHPSAQGVRDAPVDLVEVLEEVLEQFPDDLVQGTLPSREVKLTAPPHLLRMALHALIENACDASPPGSQVRTSLRVAGGRAVLLVEDQGPGIPPGILAHIGEPFVTTKPPGRGTGLGLFLVRQLADRCSGSVTFQPRSTGGTRVSLHLPLENRGERPGPLPSDPAKPHPDPGPSDTTHSGVRNG